MELALAPTLAAQAPVPTRPNRATQRSVPAFLNKLYSMVADQSTDDLIRWSDDGDSFFVPSADRFGKELLPRFFKHSNFGSFVRQLNMYGFHKVPHLQQGVLKRDQSEEADVLEFSNPHFMRGQPDLLCMIKRQKAGKGETAAAAAVAAAAAGSSLSLDGRSASSSAATGGTSSHAAASLNIATLLSDLAAIRKHQTAISADLKDLQARNHALWQEAVQSREKHKKQEETINKILRFLAGVFGGQVLDAGAAAHPQVVEGAASPMSTTSSAASPPQTGGTAAANATTGKAGGGTNGSATTTGGSGSSGTRKGNGHSGAGVVLMPKSRLLLEDVKGRQRQRRAALRELDGEDDEGEEEEDVDDDEERLGGRSRRQPRPRRRRVKTEGEEEERNEDNGVEIEEIPLLNAAEDEEDMPVISSALITSGSTALTRAPSHSHSAYLPTTTTSSSSSRFTALPSPAPAFASDPPPHPPTSANANGSSSSSLIDPAQYNLPPEALKALLTAAGDNPQALQDFFLRATTSTSTTTSNGNYNPHQGALIPSSAAAGASSFMGTSSVAAPSWTSSLAGPSALASTSSSSGGATTSSALLPYSYAQPHYTSNPLDFSSSSNPSFAATTPPTTSLGMTSSAPISAPSAAAALPSPVNFETAFAETNDVLSSVLTEKADIDQRTAALENQIAKLLDHLPDDAREQVENEAANGDSSQWAGIDWENYTNDDGGVDFDKMLAQLSEISSNGEAPIDYSELLANNALDPALSGAASSISSAPTPTSTSTSTSAAAMIDPSLYGLGTDSHQQQPAYEVTSPADTPTASYGGRNLRAEEEEGEGPNLASPASSIHSLASTASSRKGPAAGGGGKGKKRKSDAIAEPSTAVGGGGGGGDDEPAAAGGARRSTRRKRS